LNNVNATNIKRYLHYDTCTVHVRRTCYGVRVLTGMGSVSVCRRISGAPVEDLAYVPWTQQWNYVNRFFRKHDFTNTVYFMTTAFRYEMPPKATLGTTVDNW